MFPSTLFSRQHQRAMSSIRFRCGTAWFLALLWTAQPLYAFVVRTSDSQTSPSSTALLSSPSVYQEQQSPTSEALAQQKARLLGLVRAGPVYDPVLCDPLTKEDLSITSRSTIVAGAPRSRIVCQLKSPSNTYSGSSDRFWNLLEPDADSQEGLDAATTTQQSSNLLDSLIKSATPLLPTPLRSALATAGLPMGSEYVPMRDLFTSPSVSFAYERGWRQAFARAGFPGPDREAELAMEYFAPIMARNSDSKVLVDMSCATGLFTRRFAKSGNYIRVLGCDYSESMLEEARRRIESDPELKQRRPGQTQLDLVRLDVGQIPMKDGSVDAMNAGAAMHCWPDLPTAASEIYRVLKPGGRYFATTFLSSWFGVLQNAEGGAAGPSKQAFQYFASVEQLRDLMASGGFEQDKISIEVLGAACVVIRCEK